MARQLTNKLHQNASGANDFTAYDAINNVTQELRRRARRPVTHVTREDPRALFYVKYNRFVNYRSKAAKMKDCPYESEEQQILFAWAKDNTYRFPDLEWMFHVPNGGKRDGREAKRFEAEGVKSGVPDIILPVARNGYHSLAIELKRQKHGRTEPEQKAWNEYLNGQRWKALVCYGAYDAKCVLEQYLGNSL
jgi:hypothetical protein